MLKKMIYPKTKRLSNNNKWLITEKVDGSNLTIFKYNGELCIAQRNWIFKASELDEFKDKLYGGLYGWVQGFKDDLVNNLHEGSAIIGEWLGMSKGDYKKSFDHRFLIFAKANVNNKLDLYNIIYDPECFKYPFIGQSIPPYIGVVPILDCRDIKPSVDELDVLYANYKPNRYVEGFVVSNGTVALKYVRMKSGELEEHHE